MDKLSLVQFLDAAKNQIGCGYCSNEKSCTKRDPKVNKAKQGCEEYEHFYLKENNINTKEHQKNQDGTK